MDASIAQTIRHMIVSRGRDKMYMVGDFAYLGNDAVVTRTLSRLCKEGVLVRVAQGIYLYPKQTRFGMKMPTVYEVANALADKEKLRIIPSGMAALNELGLSTQVPTKAVYLTDGTPRTIKLGGRTVVFRRATPKYFSYKSRAFLLAVLSMKELGEAGMTAEMLEAIRCVLVREPNQEMVRHDYMLAPQWIRRMLAI